MLVRTLVIAMVGLACAACANDRDTRVLGFHGTPAYAPITTASAASPASQGQIKRTMASKVLAAMALERVTGRKPDPARLASLD